MWFGLPHSWTVHAARELSVNTAGVLQGPDLPHAPARRGGLPSHCRPSNPPWCMCSGFQGGALRFCIASLFCVWDGIWRLVTNTDREGTPRAFDPQMTGQRAKPGAAMRTSAPEIRTGAGQYWWGHGDSEIEGSEVRPLSHHDRMNSRLRLDEATHHTYNKKKDSIQ
jgi:hypothetical protein